MDRLRKAQKILMVIAVPMSCFIGNACNDWLASKGFEFWIHFSLATAVMIVAFILLGELANILFRLMWVRGLVMWGRSVEGVWMDVVRGRKGNLEKIGVLRIEVREDGLCVSGCNYQPDGVIENAFSSVMTRFDWPLLRITFHSTQRTSGNPTSGGYAELSFEPRINRQPRRYSGFCQEFKGNRGQCQGRRVTKRERKILDNKDERHARDLVIRTARQAKMPSPTRLRDDLARREELPV